MGAGAVIVNTGTGLALTITGSKSPGSFAADSAFNAAGFLGSSAIHGGRGLQAAGASRGFLGWPTRREFGGVLLEGFGASALAESSALSALYTAIGSC